MELLSTTLDAPALPSEVSADLHAAYRVVCAAFLLTTAAKNWAGDYYWFNDRGRAPSKGYAWQQSTDLETELVELFEFCQTIEREDFNVLLPYPLSDELKSARKEIVGPFIPPVSNIHHQWSCPEIHYWEIEFPTACAFVGNVFTAYVETIQLPLAAVREAEVAKDATSSPHSIDQMLYFVLGRMSVLPDVDFPDSVLFDARREFLAVHRRRVAGMSWHEPFPVSEETNHLQTPAKVQQAYEYIKEKGPVKALLVAKHIEVSVSTFHRHYVHRLRKCGVQNRGRGYFAPY